MRDSGDKADSARSQSEQKRTCEEGRGGIRAYRLVRQADIVFINLPPRDDIDDCIAAGSRNKAELDLREAYFADSCKSNHSVTRT